VILAKTVKGYGLGEAGEGRNISHQQKKMTKRSCANRRDASRFRHADVIAETPFYRPPATARKIKYCSNGAKRSADFLPRGCQRRQAGRAEAGYFAEFFKESRTEISTTTAFGNICVFWLRHKGVSKNLFPSFPMRRARSDSTCCSVRSEFIRRKPAYEPVNGRPFRFITRRRTARSSKKAHRIRLDGGRFIAGGHEYATTGVPMIRFTFTIDVRAATHGDLFGSRATSRDRIFARPTAGRTTLKAEGLQHPRTAQPAPSEYDSDLSALRTRRSVLNWP